MLKIYKVISTIIHPVFLPTITGGVYLYTLPLPLSVAQKYLIFFIVVGATFLIPALTLVLLKMFGKIKSNDAKTIEERKFPVLIMIVNYLFLASSLKEIWQLKELTVLAYATAIGLILTSILFYFKIKSSLHMLGITGVLGFTIIYGINYTYNSLTIAFLILLSGILATARLQLKAHNLQEIVIGSSLGLFLPILLNLIL